MLPQCNNQLGVHKAKHTAMLVAAFWIVSGPTCSPDQTYNLLAS